MTNWIMGLEQIDDLMIEIYPNLGSMTWYGVGSTADVLVRPESQHALEHVIRYGNQHDLPLRILGEGANLLVVDHVPGIVIVLDQPAFRQTHWHDDGRVEVGGGASLMKFIQECARRGWSGVEGCAGIPASLGGAIRMNAGGRFGDISEQVQWCDVISLQGDGQIERWSKERCGFGYRHSDLAGYMVVQVGFELIPVDPTYLRERVKELFKLKKESQPMGEHSSGCAFKNPPSHAAGQLIDEAGLKNYRIGQAYVSPIHANFIVADRGADVKDILHVIEHVEESIKQQTGIELQREVVVWPG